MENSNDDDNIMFLTHFCTSLVYLSIQFMFKKLLKSKIRNAKKIKEKRKNNREKEEIGIKIIFFRSKANLESKFIHATL